MKLEDFFNQQNIVDLSFFNFRNAITAAYFADKDLKILKVNDNFRSFFPVLGNVTNAYFPDVLEQLGIPSAQIESFISDINGKGSVLIPAVHIRVDGDDRVYSLLSARSARGAVIMPANRKPGVDWAAIEGRVRKGQSYRSIAHDFDASRVDVTSRSGNI